MAATTVRELGEFQLIERLAARLQGERPADEAVLRDIGDDAALWQPGAGQTSVLTTDTMLEHVHFTRVTTSWSDLGWKSLAVNVSDIAAMGALPRVALITLGLTGDESLHDVDALYDGVAAVAAAYRVVVVGGDTVRAPQVLVGFALIGEAPTEGAAARVLRRDTARDGDLLVVTGHPGQAAAGLEFLLNGDAPVAPEALLTAHRRPRPRVDEARWLLERGVRCATDSSDSLWREAQLLAVASDLGVTLDAAALPLSPALRASFPDRAASLALYGGEDYELVLALAPTLFHALRPTFEATFDLPLTAVGQFITHAAGPRVAVRGHDGPRDEFEHFPRAPR